MMDALRQRWRALPRAAQWLIVAAIVGGLYFAVIEPILDATASYSASADVLQAGLDRTRARRAEDSESGRALALGAARFGAPLLPASPGATGADDRAAALNARIESILRDRRLRALSIKARTPVALGRDVLADVVGPDEQAQRLVIDLDFEADPEAAMAVIADLERAPEVAAIGRVSLRRLDREGQKVVQVSVSPEAWIIARKGGRR
jgi:hypothetical protein